MILLVLFCSVSFAEVDTYEEQAKLIAWGQGIYSTVKDWYMQQIPNEEPQKIVVQRKPIISIRQLPTSKDLYRASAEKKAWIVEQLIGCRIVENGMFENGMFGERDSINTIRFYYADGTRSRDIRIYLLHEEWPETIKPGDWVFFRGIITKVDLQVSFIDERTALHITPVRLRVVQRPYKALHDWMPRGATPATREQLMPLPRVSSGVLERFKERIPTIHRRDVRGTKSRAHADYSGSRNGRARSTRSKRRKPIPE